MSVIQRKKILFKRWLDEQPRYDSFLLKALRRAALRAATRDGHLIDWTTLQYTYLAHVLNNQITFQLIIQVLNLRPAVAIEDA